MGKGDHIPDDMVADILLRLPSKSLLRFKSVCKTWYSSISDSEFINLHANQGASQNPKKILFSTGSQFQIIDYQSSSFSGCLSDPIPFPEETSPFHPLKILGSCRGLVCLASSTATLANDGEHNFFIWNPSTRDLKTIRWWPLDLKHPDYLHGFSYDSVSKDYILVISAGISTFFYFRFKKGFWTQIFTGISFDPRYCSIPPTTATRPSTSQATELNRVLHWLVTPDHSYSNGPEINIMTFDLATRKPGLKSDNNILKVPALLSSSWSSRKSVVGLFEHNGCLCVYFSPIDRSKEIWTMEKYGDNNSWVHLLTVPNPEESIIDFPYAPIVCISPRDELILRDHGTFIRFKSKEGKFDDHIQPNLMNSAALCALDTLVSPTAVCVELIMFPYIER